VEQDFLHEEDCVGEIYTEKDRGTGLLHEEDCVGEIYTEKDCGTGLFPCRGLCRRDIYGEGLWNRTFCMKRTV
jgi:hypothetical protein